MKLTLKVSEKQARVISTALELYSRVGMGQFSAIIEFITLPEMQEFHNNIEKIRECLQEIRQLSGVDSGSYGIYQTKDKYRISYDLHQSIRHTLAWHENPEGGYQVSYDSPMKTGTEPLAEISIASLRNVLK